MKLPYTIAEIGQAHDGSLGIAHSYIDALSSTGISAIKFQMHYADAESSIHEPFRVNFSYEDKTRFDYWKRMEFTFDEWVGIKKHCEEKNVEFLCSPFSIKAFEYLEKLNVKRYKIGSGEIRNFLLLDKINSTQKPVIFSNGLGDDTDISRCIERLNNCEEITLLQCTTEYPTPLNKTYVNEIPRLKEKFDVNIGLSDHSGTIFPSLYSYALGATAIEFHVCFDKLQFGPDSSSSLTISQCKELTEGLNAFYIMSNCHRSNYNSTSASIFGKSLTFNKNLKKGHVLKIDDLETTKPFGFGVPPEEYQKLLGLKLTKDVKINDFITKDDFK